MHDDLTGHGLAQLGNGTSPGNLDGSWAWGLVDMGINYSSPIALSVNFKTDSKT